MTSVDLNRLKGNYAEALAMAWLSRKCLVRPVADGTDIGIDLFCEAIVDHVPYLHFWVQVKVIPRASLTIQGGATTARYSFDKKHLEYWNRQPIPVYAFLVPLDSWPPVEPDAIYGVSVTRKLVENGLPTRDSVTYRTTDSFGRDSLDEDLHDFVTMIVPWDTSVLLLKRGIVAPIPHHTGHFPLGIGFQHLTSVLGNIREASVFGLLHSLLAEPSDDSMKSVRNRFETVAKIFESEMPNMGLSVLVRSAHADGNFELAKEYIQRALDRISSDKTLTESDRSRRQDEVRGLLADFENP